MSGPFEWFPSLTISLEMICLPYDSTIPQVSATTKLGHDGQPKSTLCANHVISIKSTG
jgi:hypothetical protein